jgi:hypothetical protein
MRNDAPVTLSPLDALISEQIEWQHHDPVSLTAGEPDTGVNRSEPPLLKVRATGRQAAVTVLGRRIGVRDTRPRDAIDVGRAWSAAMCAWVTHDRLLSRRMPPPADYPTRRSSPLSRPGKPRRWHTWQPTIWVLRRTRLGPSAPLRPPVRLWRHGSGNESRSEKDSPRRFENWSSMTSEVEARSLERIRRLTLAPSSPPTLIATDHSGARKPTPL